MLDHLRFRHRALAALAVTAGALIGPALAQARTETASAGGVSARFTFYGSAPFIHNDSLTISRGGKVVYRAPVRSRWCGSGCGPGGGVSGTSVHVLDLGHTGAMDVLVDLYTGGAHCCWIEQVFFPRGSGYAKVERNFGDYGARLKDLGHNGRHEFLTANDAFAYQFTSFAASGLPIQIVSFRHGAFHDVTRADPKLIAKDAKTWLGLFTSHLDDGEGFIAAWAADEYLLGRKAQAITYLNAQATAGDLNNAQNPALSGHRFVLALERFLSRQGY